MISCNNNQVRWVVLPSDEALTEHLITELGLEPVVARLLVNRGVTTPTEAEHFLHPSLSHLHDPSLLPDIEPGVDRIASAIKSGEKICVHGDYDVDGVTSTALLVRTLSALKADVEYVLPHRHKDGYGIKPGAVDKIRDKGCGLIVTCDCGITACDTVARASELGMDMIVTDHHEPGPVLPNALAVINPKREDAKYPFSDLAGVGVAFKFAQEIVRKLGHSTDSFIEKFIDLAALGTVADVVPLVGENRAIVKFGLDAIPKSKKIGFKTMLEAAKVAGKPLTAYHLSFILAPRINAVGRMDDAQAALRLFLTKDVDEAGMLAEEMERHNSDRKAEQQRIQDEAIEQVASKDLSSARVLVLSNEGWNAGVIGIVAGKLCETFGRPAIVISRDPETGMGGGSARSVEPFNMVEGLRHCSDLLGRFGGHALAAGLSIPLENMDAFEERINALASEVIPEAELAPRIDVEMELKPTEITRKLADMIALLEPYGEANPEPLFMSRDLTVLKRQRVGDGSHLKLTVQGKNAPPIDCIAFKMGDVADDLELGSLVDLCYNIRLNSFNGNETVQLVVKAIRNA